MKLQFYETLEDKSKEYLLYLIEQISPNFTESELQIFLEKLGEAPSKTKKSSKSNKDFVQIGGDKDKPADLSKLNIEKLKFLFQTFISREKNDKNAVKWRFYQYVKYMKDLNLKSIKINLDPNPNLGIDFIIETEENEIILASCYDILELNDYNESLNKINEFVKDENLIPDRIIFAALKTFRNIPIDTPIKIINEEILPEMWIEWIEADRPFNNEDLLIVNNSDLKIAGYNFTSIDDMLNYVFKHSNGGQISVFKQIDFFTEVSDEEPQVELIWKGIMIK